ncbi:hypothetical protein NG800_011090 [Epilithonimonas ginsengisoli]|uniref:Uncharacterized protein n=1 Tax=Epilithonimonas ginsengisoli TaxID=1245592 RepID=A0ABU4JIM5_9FLAO|nr:MULTISPECIES: hypothetical protein [Chryseobacterium group]MBV6878855.1 hypothetical protein [Epilithonimonas sp. FP105]MDW8549459.1 hypothetical protein [Epilithonimonas ginsengisoli]
MENLKPIIEILQALNKEQELNVLPRWLGRNRNITYKNQWASFAGLVKTTQKKFLIK